jgi:hypothetical protein
MLIVVDSAHPLVRQNRCFDLAYEYSGCGHAINVRLAREARRHGLKVVTADVYLETKEPASQAACLTDMVSPFTEILLAHGVKAAICMSHESPLNAKNFYHNIVRYAGRFHHNYQFRGTQERLAGTGTVFHPIVFPMETRVPMIPQSWDKRGYLILVNSNKRAFYQKRANIKEIALKAIDPWMRVREIYVDRIEAIHYFSSHSDFGLYGIGWEQPIQGFGADYHKAALKVYKGSIPADVRCKREVMNSFKFALCFENCAFPGYVTEKIFDCFLAGCIPVYLGAPDITDFVPPQTFVDYRKFENYSDLDRFLRGMTESEARHYLEAAQDFLASLVFDKFTVDYFVNDILNVLEQKFNSKG